MCASLGMCHVVRYDDGMSAIAQILRFCLALMLAFTLSHATVARNQGGTIAGWVALCAGDDVMMVAVDASGAPVAPHLPCPDCIMAGAVLMPSATVIAAPMQMAGRLARAAGDWFTPWDNGISPAARGPPPFA